MARKTKEKQLREFKAEFLADFTHHRSWLKEIQDDERFYDGEQWTQEEKSELEKRGQPVVTLNRIKPKVDALVGAEMGRPVNMKAFPRGIRDASLGKHISEALRYCEYHMDFDSIENEAFRKQLVGGLAWYELLDHWDRHTFDHDVRCKLWSAHDIIRDRYSCEVDLSDCRRLHATHYVRQDELKLLFPGNDMWLDSVFIDEPKYGFSQKHRQHKPDQYDSPDAISVDNAAGYGLFVRPKEREIRLVKTLYREPFIERYVSVPALGTERVTDWDPADIKKILKFHPEGVEFSEVRYRLNSATYIWNRLLEEKKNIVSWDPDAHYPFVMAPGMEYQERKRKGQFVGIVRGMKDANKEVNKRRSKTLHLLNTNLIIREEGAVEHPDLARDQVNRADGDVVVRNGFRFEIQRNIDLAQSQLTLLQEAKSEIDNVGVRSEVQGGSAATSGRDFQLRHEVASHPTRPYLRNLRDAKKRFFMLVLDRIQQYWHTERLVKISDDPEAQAIPLNRVVQDPVTGAIQVLNNVSIGKYDIILEEVPETVNLENEAYKDFVQLAGIMAQQQQPVPIDMLIELSPFAHKQKLLERMAQSQNATQAQMQQGSDASGFQ